MAKSRIADEVQVFRFFDEAPLEKAETVFKLVTERMRARMGPPSGARSSAKKHAQTPAPRVVPTETGI